MRYVAAYLLATLGGNKKPSKGDLEKILGSVGIEADSDRVAQIIKELTGKNVEDVIKAGKEKLAAVPTGGAVAASSGGGAAPAAEEKKEEKKEESEESDDDMGFGLFD